MTSIEADLDISVLRTLLRYESETGHLYWLASGGRRMVDMPAGKICGDGYRRIGINNKHYMAHRLAWAIANGAYPLDQLDHINRVRDDNRISNLREASCRQNNTNKGRDVQLIGATLIPASGKWQSQIKIDGKTRYLGLFDTSDQAAQAYIAARGAA